MVFLKKIYGNTVVGKADFKIPALKLRSQPGRCYRLTTSDVYQL